MEIVSLVASIVSVIIGGFAIWLSVVFYKMSVKTSEDIKESSKSISSSVERLEKLFDKLYSDTFSMMRDTVSDMRKHMWPDSESVEKTEEIVQKKADQKIEQLRTEIRNELENVVLSVGKTDAKLNTARKELETMMDKVIRQSRLVEKEAREETAKSMLLRMLSDFIPGDKLNVDQIVRELSKRFDINEVLRSIYEIGKEGRIEFENKIRNWRELGPDTVFTLRDKI